MTRRLAFAVAFPVMFACRLLGAEDHAPLPERLATAKSAYLANESGDLKAFDNFYRELRKWNRFEIVTARERADIVMVLATVSSSQVVSGTAVSNGGVTTGYGTATAIPALELKILDTSTSDVLWSDVTDKWMSAGHAPSKLVSRLKERCRR